MKISSFGRLIRIQQWIKNLLLFFPLIFSDNLLVQSLLIKTLVGFLAFSLMASAIYILNDLRDIPFDRQHPIKKSRPTASGLVGREVALTISAVFGTASLGIGLYAGLNFVYILILYLLINLVYTYKLRAFAIVDVTTVASGYLLRIFAGGIIGGIAISHWMIMVTFLLALFLAIAKRRDDIILEKTLQTNVRSATSGYNLEFTNLAMTLFGSTLIISYIMYTISPEVTERIGSRLLYLTGFPVIVGVLRYIQLLVVKRQVSDPFQILLGDRFMQLIVLAWLFLILFIMYS